MELPWALQSSCKTNQSKTTSEISIQKQCSRSTASKNEQTRKPRKYTWHHRSMNSKCGHFSKRCANTSINLSKYLLGIDETTTGMSMELTAKMHFLIRESSFSLRLRIKALVTWSSLSAASTPYRIQRTNVKEQKTDGKSYTITKKQVPLKPRVVSGYCLDPKIGQVRIKILIPMFNLK